MNNKRQPSVQSAVYKIQHRNIPIIKAWMEEEHKLKAKSEDLKKTKRNLLIATSALIVGLSNIAFKNPLISTLVVTASCFVVASSAHNFSLKAKENKFNQAIFSYEELKEYEKTHPNEKEITTNPTLKGISKRKILKRTKQI